MKKKTKSAVSASAMQHIAIEVSSMEKSLDFYKKTLGMKLTERHKAFEIKEIPVELSFLRLGSSKKHHDLVLVHDPGKTYEKKQESRAPNFHHMGFSFEKMETWEGQLEHIRAEKIPIIRGPVIHSPFQEGGEGSWGENKSFYVLDPDGHRIEFFCHMADVDEKGYFRNEEGALIAEEARAWEY